MIYLKNENLRSIAAIHHLAIFRIAYRNLKFTNNIYSRSRTALAVGWLHAVVAAHQSLVEAGGLVRDDQAAVVVRRFPNSRRSNRFAVDSLPHRLKSIRVIVRLDP
jgi:hypothetical protein